MLGLLIVAAVVAVAIFIVASVKDIMPIICLGITLIIFTGTSIGTYFDDKESIDKQLHKKDVTICKLQNGRMVNNVCIVGGKVVKIK